MATVAWRGADVQRQLEALVGAHMAEATAAAKARLQERTPVRTGFLRASEYGAVIDGDGGVVAGDSTDGNGEAVPVNGGAANVFAALLGANAPYAIYVIETGSRGRPGSLLVSQEQANLAADIRQRLDRIGGA